MLFLHLELRTLKNAAESQLVHAVAYTVVNNMKEGMNLHLRDGWCEGADVCTLCISTVALWTGPVDAQSIHLWGVFVSHLNIIQKDALWLSISSLGSTNQSSWEISSDICSGPELWC